MLINIFCFIIGLLGAVLLAYGAWLLLPALGFIVGGVLCMLWSFFMARGVAVQQANTQKKGD